MPPASPVPLPGSPASKATPPPLIDYAPLAMRSSKSARKFDRAVLLVSSLIQAVFMLALLTITVLLLADKTLALLGFVTISGTLVFGYGSYATFMARFDAKLAEE